MISETLKIILLIIITFLGFPAGILIKKITKDEQKSGRKYFKLLISGCVFGIILSLIFIRENLIFIIAVFLFIILITIPSLIKGRK